MIMCTANIDGNVTGPGGHVKLDGSSRFDPGSGPGSGAPPGSGSVLRLRLALVPRSHLALEGGSTDACQK